MYRQHEGIRTGRYMQYIQPFALGGTATVILPKTPSAEVQTHCVPVNGTAGPPWRQRGESWQMRTIMGRTCDPLRAVCAASRNTHPSCRHHPFIRGHRRMLAGRHNTYNIPAAARAPGFAARQPRSQRRAAVPRCAPSLSALPPLMHTPPWSPGPAMQTLSNSNALRHAGELPAPACHTRA